MTKMLKWTLIGIAGWMRVTAWAAGKAPDFQLQITEKQILATPPAGHHFNIKAPMQLDWENDPTRIKPTEATEKKVRFETSSHTPCAVQISLYLCDDANTYCEKHAVRTQWSATSSTPAKSIDKNITQQKDAQAPSGVQNKTSLDTHGFYDNQPDEAFRLAREKKLPLLIDFYGIWCPPCNELSDKVFSTPEFKAQSKRFIKLKMDADAPASEELSARYHITGFPTVIFASSDGDEILRVVGFRPKSGFLSEMNRAWTARTAPLSVLKSQADAGDRAAQERLGSIYYDREENERAIRYLKETTVQKEKLLSAEARLLSEKSEAGDSQAKYRYAEALEKVIRAFPDSPDSIGRRETLADLLDQRKLDGQARLIRQDLITAAHKLIAQPSRLQGYDSSLGDLWVSIAETQQALGKNDEAQAAWRSAAAEFQRKLDSGARRGATLELAYCLQNLNKIDDAEKLYLNMEQAYPSEFTFFRGHARMNYKLKRYEQALGPARRAHANAYGANRLETAELLANILKAMKKPAEAREVIQEALHAAPNTSGAKSRMSRRIEKLKKLNATLT